MLAFAEKRGGIADNPCGHVEVPQAGTHDDGDIRYLSPDVEALCRAVPAIINLAGAPAPRPRSRLHGWT